MTDRTPPARPRRPKHPYLVPVPLAATMAAVIAAIVGLTPAGGEFAWAIWWGALVIVLVSAVPTAIAGFMDLAALRRTTHAARTAVAHGGIMLAAMLPLVFAVVLGADRMGDGVGVVEAVVTFIGAAVLLGGATVGLIAMHVYGAGAREETLTDENRGERPVARPMAGVQR
jgi:uncharacterized membrane protein